jgi:hypothetical protein
MGSKTLEAAADRAAVSTRLIASLPYMQHTVALSEEAVFVGRNDYTAKGDSGTQ